MKIETSVALVYVLASITRATPTVLTSENVLEDSLNILKKTMDDDGKIRDFCHEYHGIKNYNGYFWKPSNCAELMYSGISKSGVYTIYPKLWARDTNAIQVYCDMETDGGGWTVFQKRSEYPERQINFTRSWTSYADGFGNLNEEFWLGNKHLHALTTQDNVVLRVELEDFEENRRYAQYNGMEVGSENDRFKLKLSDYIGDAGDSLSNGNGQRFYTYDWDAEKKCAQVFKGGWWYNACHLANLNGKYLAGKHESFADGIEWHSWLGYHYSLKRTEMKIRPKTFVSK